MLTPSVDRALRDDCERSLERSRARRLVASLREDPRYAELVTPEALERNRRLVGALDAISLMLCMRRFPYTVEVPKQLELTALDEEGARARLDPWPFGPDSLSVRCEGRRLEGRFQTDDELRSALDSAPWKTLEFELVP